MPNSRRKLISDDQVIVILDTNTARVLAYPHESTEWCETFARMAGDGYSFSLADAAGAELVAQRHRGALTAEECARICDKLETFLSRDYRILLGKVDVGGMLGINEVHWSERESRHVSQEAWKFLKRCADPTAPQDSFAQELQDERDDWIALFDGWNALLDSIQAESPEDVIDLNDLTEGMLKMMDSRADNWSELIPPMSVRSHLRNRYYWRQFVRTRQPKDAYNPRAKRKVNDGIDADLYNYLPLPALIVSQDEGFFRRLGDITSFQKAWLFKPQDLAGSWLQGNRPQPIWP